MNLSDYINPEFASLEQAQTAHDCFHELRRRALLAARTVLIEGATWESAFHCLYDLLNDLDTESRYLVEDILDEMNKEDEGGII